MAELEALVRAAGADVVGRIAQRRAAVDPATLLGLGKIEDISQAVKANAADVVVTLNALRPRQRKTIEQRLGDGVAVMDRTVVILDLFAAHARTSEGKLQVEVAQLRHRAANLIGSQDALSRLGGGIGTRGPGETKLEVDRRRIRLRITRLEKELANVAKRRREQRRSRAGAPVIALVGYTNAGKSSLLNALSGADVFVADQPFATLDPTLRRVRLSESADAVLADTVGFISDLPKELLAAFRATLEEVTDASLLVHVIDASNPFWQRQRIAVEEVLEDLKASDKPLLLAFNKIDAAPPGFVQAVEGIAVSAKTGAGLADLKNELARRVAERPNRRPRA
ncbi:MAG: GTPase HflX [Candidatus Eremiobacteraeota bacterium]|nr:GTPase HflX [Candidatus Eremiobacteraeota bacterium]